MNRTHKQFVLTIYDKDDNPRHYDLEHTYDSLVSAESEAEKMADQLYTETDIDWTVSEKPFTGE